MSKHPKSTPSLPSTPTYTPPPELVQAAEESLAAATPEDLADAARAYVAYGSVTGGRSAVTGSELPGFTMCNTLVRAGWLRVARELRPSAEVERARAELADVASAVNRDIAEADQKLYTLNQEIAERARVASSQGGLSVGTTTLTVDVSELKAELDQMQESVRQFSAMDDSEDHIDPFLMGIREIAGAARDLADAKQRATGSVVQLVDDVTEALHARVKALASPPSAS